MQQTEFIETIRERADLDSNEEAETVTVATLHALGTGSRKDSSRTSRSSYPTSSPACSR